MIGRRVKPFQGELGEIIKWEPLGSAMCDVLVRYDSGREVWHASHSCEPVDDHGPLPSRQAARETSERVALLQLSSIRAQHVEDFNKPWPGMEFGKVVFAHMVDGAIKDLESGSGNE